MTHRSLRPDETQNRFLARLPEAEYLRLLPHLEQVHLETDQVLYEARGLIEYVYFPVGAVLSSLVLMEDENAIEVGTVGSEGLVGYLGFGGQTSPHKVLVQIGDGGYRMPAQILRQLAESDGMLRDRLAAYHLAFITQISQTVACNGLHGLQQRCCRWLLMSRDRVGSDDIRLTHEFLAIMLGARRASVTDVLGPLQEAGLIRCERSRIVLLDREGLEARSCECYAVVRDEYDRLLGRA